MINEKNVKTKVLLLLVLGIMRKEKFTITSINRLITKYYCNIL